MIVQQVLDVINEYAPFETQLSFDNSGLLVGDPCREVTGIHFALDVTAAVIDEAVAHDANLIVTHHPAYVQPHQAPGGNGLRNAAALPSYPQGN